jgi:DNA-binding winged helix-turn-helix (wHTH) protein
MEVQGQASRIQFGSFVLDTRSGELRKAGTRIRLQDQPRNVLCALLSQPGEVVTREEMKRLIWPEDSFGDFDHAVNVAVAKIRAAISDSADNPRYIETLPRRGYRFISPVTLAPAMLTGQPAAEASATAAPVRRATRFSWVAAVCGTTAILGLVTASWWYFFHKKPALTNKDTIVLADFANSTGEPVFDSTLGRGLSIQLEQSPFLSILSDKKTHETLQLMNQKPDARLTRKVAIELCQRAASAAVLDGSIAQIGTHYLLTLQAINCSNGEVIAGTEALATDKDHVLEALGTVATEIRNKLGESRGTLQKLDTPLAEATTSSLPALQAYSLGETAELVNAGPFYRRAIELDPNFAKAYAELAEVYMSAGEGTLGTEYASKAYELREHLSEREKLDVEFGYHVNVTGDLHAAQRAGDVAVHLYPRDLGLHEQLGGLYFWLGQYDKALQEFLWTPPQEPLDNSQYGSLVDTYVKLNRIDDARAIAAKAQAQNFNLPYNRYSLAFLQNDPVEMKRQVEFLAGDPTEELMFSVRGDTEAYFGHLRKARDLSARAIEISGRNNRKRENSAEYRLNLALHEAEVGNAVEAREGAGTALALSPTRDVKFLTALTLALAGDAAKAQVLADDVEKQSPRSTMINGYWLPCVRAAVQIDRNNPAKAVELLEAAAPYDMAFPYPQMELAIYFFPVYVRGQAYLRWHKGREAATEFQKFLDHRGAVGINPLGALAHLGLARAYVLQGDIAKARGAYQNFLALWKDADPDIPVLMQARAEYASLNSLAKLVAIPRSGY